MDRHAAAQPADRELTGRRPEHRMDCAAGSPRPLVVGIGGSGRPGSVTEWALDAALRGARQADAEIQTFEGTALSALPLYRPDDAARCAYALQLLDAVARADGLIVATPSYHGGVSGMVKNALDYLEDLRDYRRPYLDGRAVGCVVTSAGWQTGGATLSALRSIVHALRGWPTPLGLTVNVAESPVQAQAQRLHIIGQQVVDFANAFRDVSGPVVGATL
jgi:FMN reductase